MLSSEHLRTVEQLTRQLDARQLAWLSGYLAGVQERTVAINTPSPTATQSENSLTATVLYGSQSGNGKTIADRLVAAITARGLTAVAMSMANYKTARLKKERFLFVIISTHGEGEPPDTAAIFYAFLHGARAPQLPDLHYAVLALGDSSYEFFCQTGRDIDARLAALGATALVERVECDVDFERSATRWQTQLIDTFAKVVTPDTLANGVASEIILEQTPLVPTTFNRQHPFTATLLENIVLSAPSRQTRHLEFSLAESGLHFTPGDSLGVWPHNPPTLVTQTAAALELPEDAVIVLDDESATVAEWLQQRLDINFLTPAVLTRYHALVGGDALESLANNRHAAQQYLTGRHLLDVLVDFPPPSGAGTAILSCLRRLTPRLYSLASSLLASEEEAHILVAHDSYSGFDNRLRTGLCSDYLARLQPEDTARVFIQKNDAFCLPADDTVPLIMIGSGTGVAPFRAFMEEREERGASGKNWLFFGERHRREDFYYQTEWQAKLQNGALTKLTAAFSRDSARKIYVQHKLREHGKTLWQWLEDGAYIYVCGCESPMAKDVHQMLAMIVEEHGGTTGTLYLEHLREAGRYQRDVY